MYKTARVPVLNQTILLEYSLYTDVISQLSQPTMNPQAAPSASDQCTCQPTTIHVGDPCPNITQQSAYAVQHGTTHTNDNSVLRDAERRYASFEYKPSIRFRR